MATDSQTSHSLFQVDYVRGQDAQLLLTGRLDIAGQSLIALSPDSYSIAVSVNNQLIFFDGLTGDKDESIENICTGRLSISDFGPKSIDL